MSDDSESGPFRLADSPSHLLHRAEQLAADHFAQLAGDIITLRQFAVLAAISEAPGLSQSDLVRATGIDKSTLADMIARMQKRGWITRATSALDGRAHSVHLAASGSLILAGATKHAKAADAALVQALSRPKRRALINLLSKLAAAADESAEKAERDARREAKREAKRDKVKSERESARKRR